MAVAGRKSCSATVAYNYQTARLTAELELLVTQSWSESLGQQIEVLQRHCGIHSARLDIIRYSIQLLVQSCENSTGMTTSQ